ncbi:flagellar type III secretion system pore protein FliP [Clostridium sp.]|uniref:flagellar type III secretion system pore protein FliP n=1 Tax=Clostridium sp. TaxID=1506 RepID=UPI002631847E|nr:flagellar type III secretion system pore protein FliP [Clostridium sp.]
MDIFKQILSNGSELTPNMQMFILMTALMFLPIIIFMMTSFVRIIITFSFIKSALGAQQAIPNQILVGLAICLTLFIMKPVVNEIATNSIEPYINHEITMEQAYDELKNPISDFLIKQTRDTDIELFIKNSSIDTTNIKNPEDLPLSILVPAFAISELKTSFEIGFIIYIPFLVIDLVVSSALMSMGMMMLPPAMVSLPFKLLLFVMVDGWDLLIKSLIQSFTQ